MMEWNMNNIKRQTDDPIIHGYSPRNDILLRSDRVKWKTFAIVRDVWNTNVIVNHDAWDDTNDDFSYHWPSLNAA